jgi:hypothetical protein
MYECCLNDRIEFVILNVDETDQVFEYVGSIQGEIQ